jgi:pseudaminic acid cytidylyltransferase
MATPSHSTTPHPRSVAVIPARGGSKRIPRKNVRLMSGEPLMTWTIRNAIASGVFDEVVVSTDDAEIAEVSRQAGAVVPFARSAELASDHATTAAVVVDTIENLEQAEHEFELVCCLYPASIFVSPQDIVASRAELLSSATTDFVLTVARFDTPIERALDLKDDRVLSPVAPEHMGTRTQDLPVRYRDVGQLYWGRRQAWLEGRGVFDNSIGYIMDSARVQDIDTEEDWELAQLLHTRGLRVQSAEGR